MNRNINNDIKKGVCCLLASFMLTTSLTGCSETPKTFDGTIDLKNFAKSIESYEEDFWDDSFVNEFNIDAKKTLDILGLKLFSSQMGKTEKRFFWHYRGDIVLKSQNNQEETIKKIDLQQFSEEINKIIVEEKNDAKFIANTNTLLGFLNLRLLKDQDGKYLVDKK